MQLIRKTNNPVKKWVEDLNRHFSKEEIQKYKQRDGQQVHKKMLNITHQRNANQNYNEVSLHTSQNGHHYIKFTKNKCWRGFEEMEPSYTVGGNVNWYSHNGEQYGVSLKN